LDQIFNVQLSAETLHESQDGNNSHRVHSVHSIVSEFSSPEAEIKFWKEEVERLEERQAPTNPSRLLEALLNLGNAYLENKQAEDAEPVLLRVREQMIKIWGWDHVCSQSCVESLRKLFVSKNDLDAAQAIYTDALDGVRRALGSEHPWTSQLQNNTACLCMDRNDLDSAEKLLRKALRAKSTVFGPNHGTTLKTKCNLALVAYLKDGGSGSEEFEALLSSALDGLKEAWGKKDDNTVAVARQLISLHFETENAQAGHQICHDLNIERKYLICIFFS
jgi:tetratricopeptide (TPR) repeat protein